MYYRWCRCVVSCFIICWSCLASAAYSELDDEELLFVDFMYKQYLLEQSITIYHNSDRNLIGLANVAHNLGFAIEIDLKRGYASGWFAKEENTFELMIARGIALVKGKKIELDDNFVMATDGIDIYVDSRFLHQWFGLDFEFRMDNLQLIATTSYSLPIELRLKREKKRKKLLNRSNKAGRDLPIQADKYRIFNIPSIDFETSMTVSQEQSKNSYSLSLSNDILWHSAEINIRQYQSQASQIQVNISKKVTLPGASMNFGVTEYQLGDIFVNGDVLVNRAMQGAGFIVERQFTRSLERSFNKTSLQGNASPGWEIELYRNNLLIDHQLVSSLGRYSFTDIPLKFGRNHFELKLYGPQGQIKRRFETVNINDEMIKPQQWQYSFYVLDANNSLFKQTSSNLSSQLSTDVARELKLGASVFYGLSNKHSLGLSYFQNTHKDESEVLNQFTQFTWICALNQLSLRLSGVKQIGKGYALDLEANTEVDSQSISFAYQKFYGIDSDKVPTDEAYQQFDFNMFGNLTANYFNGINYSATINALHNKNQGFTYRADVNFATSLYTSRVNLGFFYQSSNSRTDGKLNTYLDWQDSFEDLLVKSSLHYELMPMFQPKSLDLTISSPWAGGRYQLQTLYNFSSKEKNWSLAYNRALDNGMQYTIAYKHSDKLGSELILSARLSLLNQQDFPYVSVAKSGQGKTGKARLKVFLDNDGDQKYSLGDEPLSHIKFSGRSQWQGLSTNEKGELTISGIDGGYGSIIELEESSLLDPYLKSSRGPHRYVSHRGGVIDLEFPVNLTSEVEGYLMINRQKKVIGFSGVSLDLYNENLQKLATTTTAFDGYYYFSGLREGRYILKLSDVEERLSGLLQWNEVLQGDGIEFKAELDQGIVILPDIIVSYK